MTEIQWKSLKREAELPNNAKLFEIQILFLRENLVFLMFENV